LGGFDPGKGLADVLGMGFSKPALAAAAGLFVALSILSTPREARADERDLESFRFRMEAFATEWSTMPLPVRDSARPDLMGLDVPTGSPVALGGVGVDWGFRVGPLIGSIASLRWRHGVWSSSAFGTGIADETPYALRPMSLDVVEIGLPGPLAGIGVRFGESALTSFTLRADYGLALGYGSAEVAQEPSRTGAQLSASAVSAYARIEADACTPLGGRKLACLTVEPDVYEFRWFPGGSVGFKAEL
jgi:hypothetical protein